MSAISFVPIFCILRSNTIVIVRPSGVETGVSWVGEEFEKEQRIEKFESSIKPAVRNSRSHRKQEESG